MNIKLEIVIRENGVIGYDFHVSRTGIFPGGAPQARTDNSGYRRRPDGVGIHPSERTKFQKPSEAYRDTDGEAVVRISTKWIKSGITNRQFEELSSP